MARIWGEMAKWREHEKAGQRQTDQRREKKGKKGIERAKQPQSFVGQWRNWDAVPAIEAEIWRPPIGACGGRTPAGVQIGSGSTLLELESGHLPMDHLPWRVPQ